MKFKDLQKLIHSSSQSNPECTQLLDRLRDKPFWIWDQQEYRQEEIWKAVTKAAKKYAGNNSNNNGSIRLDNEVICVVGRKSG